MNKLSLKILGFPHLTFSIFTFPALMRCTHEIIFCLGPWVEIKLGRHISFSLTNWGRGVMWGLFDPPPFLFLMREHNPHASTQHHANVMLDFNMTSFYHHHHLTVKNHTLHHPKFKLTTYWIHTLLRQWCHPRNPIEKWKKNMGKKPKWMCSKRLDDM